MLDLLIRNGTVFDGTGSPGRNADLGIEGNRIAAIGDLSALEAHETIDAAGLVVAPGFIDIHSHSDITLLIDPRAQSSIAQGVTTEIIGNCGHGCAPIVNPASVTGNIYGYLPGFPLDWSTTAQFLDRLSAARPAVNVATLVPNGNLRLSTIGAKDRPATSAELDAMTGLLEEGLESGAFGYSTGLEYPSERATTEADAVHLCKVAAKAGGIYTTHTRNREVHAVEAVEEAIRVAQAADIPLQVSHITPRRGGPPDAAERAIAAVDRAARDGLDVAFDMHTRLYGFTNLSAALPPRVTEGTTSDIKRRLGDASVRAEIKHFDSLITSFGLAGWDRVELFNSPRHPELAGKSIRDLAGPNGDPMDAVLDVLLANADDIHAPMCLCHSYSEDDLLDTYRHALCTLGSDATALATDGPLAQSTFPGAFTWAAWFFRRFVRERQEFTLESAIRKLSNDPARRFNLKGRGVIEVDAFADVIAFDPNVFAERATLENPNQPATGMEHVIVNGVVTRRDGYDTGAHGGIVLRRKEQLG
jgi:N-acyl-D-aspartate/D-glutamate deacylase